MGYLGSKSASGAFQAIVSQMPPHDTYIEPFLGSGAVMLAKPPAHRSIGLDRDPETVHARDWPAQVEVLNEDAFDFLEGFDWAKAGRCLVYADPPYLLETRSSMKRYRYEFSRSDHVRLLDLVARLPALVMLSRYPSALYDQALKGWRTLKYQVMTRGGARTEQLWLNFPEGEVQWASFAGRNFTDRQRIRRKADRWARDYATLPAGERAAILAALLATHSSEA